MSVTATKNTITLKGSAQIVSEFFGHSINNILYQRGIYDPDTFKTVKKYGVPIQVTTDPALAEYLDKITGQMMEWLAIGQLKKLVLVIANVDDGETIERWQFDVDTNDKAKENIANYSVQNLKKITKEIQAVIRQITSSVTFLPLLDVPCTFDLLMYTDQDVLIPAKWEESDPKYINNSNQVRLRSFTTKIHKVNAMVTYKQVDDDE